MAFFAVSGLRAQADAFRSGGQRRIALPETGPDPTDTEAALDGFLARRRELSGERRLLLAIFTASLDDLRRYPRTSKPYAQAWRWLMGDDERWPYAFRPMCSFLDLDPGAVRARVGAVAAPPLPSGPHARGVAVRCGRAPVRLLVRHATSPA